MKNFLPGAQNDTAYWEKLQSDWNELFRYVINPFSWKVFGTIFVLYTNNFKILFYLDFLGL